MKLKEALKKFNFLKRLSLPDRKVECIANHLAMTLKGSTDVHVTPLAKNSDPIVVLYEWDQIFNQNLHKMNSTLQDLERANRAKFGPRSVSVPWGERIPAFLQTYTNQDESHVIKFNFKPGSNDLTPTSINNAISTLRSTTSAGLPFLEKKKKVIPILADIFDEIISRKDPCVLYTRSQENKKTRTVWGYPIADTLLEMLFYIPFLEYTKTLYYRAALVSPELVAKRITEMIINAIANNLVLYSVDFAAFDASILYQYIEASFEYIKSHFATAFHPTLNYICERMYTIGIVTPTGIYVGKHGVPSGSTFTNEVDSIVQFCIASTLSFIKADECMIQGDDGVYAMARENIAEFEQAFAYAKLKLEKSKSHIATNYVIFCQNLFHIDYIVNGQIGGIYPTYRALNRILFMERHVDFKTMGVDGKDYFGIRCLQILENTKYHPLFEDLVRFVLDKEQFSLDISDDGLRKFCTYQNASVKTTFNLNHQYGSQVEGIKGFAAYSVIQRMMEEDKIHADEEILVEGDLVA